MLVGYSVTSNLSVTTVVCFGERMLFAPLLGERAIGVEFLYSLVACVSEGFGAREKRHT